MLTFHWTTVLAAVIALVGLLMAAAVGKPRGDFDLSPLMGCGVLLFTAVVVLSLLLIHACGWV